MSYRMMAQIREREAKAYAAEVEAALEADKGACDLCQGGSPVPHAAFTYIRNGRVVSKQCRSRCRWFNPTTRKMEGRFHCTCDSCF